MLIPGLHKLLELVDKLHMLGEAQDALDGEKPDPGSRQAQRGAEAAQRRAEVLAAERRGRQADARRVVAERERAAQAQREYQRQRDYE